VTAFEFPSAYRPPPPKPNLAKTKPNPSDPIPLAACKFMPIKMHKKEPENVLCKKDDGENKINNKFCMQTHYETMADGDTNPPFCTWAWASPVQLVFLLRVQHGVCVIRALARQDAFL